MKTLKGQKWMLIVYAVVLIAVGLVEFILGIVDIKRAINVVSYALACGLILIGLLHIISSLFADTKAFFKAALVLGSAAIAIGVVLIVEPFLIAAFLIKFVAVLALSLGVVFGVKAVLAIVYKYKGGWIFLYFLFHVVSILFGVLALVYEGAFTQGIYCATGAIVFFAGVFLLVAGIKLLSAKSEDDKVVLVQ